MGLHLIADANDIRTIRAQNREQIQRASAVACVDEHLSYFSVLDPIRQSERRAEFANRIVTAVEKILQGGA